MGNAHAAPNRLADATPGGITVSVTNPAWRRFGSGRMLGKDAGVSTIVFLHAHPDDEAILTGGTIARLAAQRHRVVIVTATDGAAGLTDTSSMGAEDLSSIRAAELEASAEALGASRVVQLGYGDSGLDGQGTPSTPGLPPSTKRHFCSVPIEAAAAQVAAVLEAERAPVLVGYDPAGGYGHPDHVRIHHVARLAAKLAGTPVLLESTLPREPLLIPVRAVYSLRRIVPPLQGLDIDAWERSYSTWSNITYKVNTRPVLAAKRRALAAHASQASAQSGPRTVDIMLRMPIPVFSLLFGTEWYTGPRNPNDRYYRHPMQSLLQAP